MAEPYEDDDGEEVTCMKCGGSGFFADCFDDLCHGEEECIHGDDTTCTECHGNGYRIIRPATRWQPEGTPPNSEASTDTKLQSR